MKKYTTLNIEFVHIADVISTSGVTTGGIHFPWSEKEESVASAYRLLGMRSQEEKATTLYEM